MTADEEFARRMPAFTEGYNAFVDGFQENPYGELDNTRGDHDPVRRKRNDHRFLNRREWRHGWTKAYFDNMEYQASRVAA